MYIFKITFDDQKRKEKINERGNKICVRERSRRMVFTWWRDMKCVWPICMQYSSVLICSFYHLIVVSGETNWVQSISVEPWVLCLHNCTETNWHGRCRGAWDTRSADIRGSVNILGDLVRVRLRLYKTLKDKSEPFKPLF